MQPRLLRAGPRAVMLHDRIAAHRSWGQAEAFRHPQTNRRRLRPGVENSHPVHAIQFDRDQQPVAKRRDTGDPRERLVPGRFDIRALARTVQGQGPARDVEIEIERCLLYTSRCV